MFDIFITYTHQSKLNIFNTVKYSYSVNLSCSSDQFKAHVLWYQVARIYTVAHKCKNFSYTNTGQVNSQTTVNIYHNSIIPHAWQNSLQYFPMCVTHKPHHTNGEVLYFFVSQRNFQNIIETNSTFKIH